MSNNQVCEPLDPMECPCVSWVRSDGLWKGHHSKCDGTGKWKDDIFQPADSPDAERVGTLDGTCREDALNRLDRLIAGTPRDYLPSYDRNALRTIKAEYQSFSSRLAEAEAVIDKLLDEILDSNPPLVSSCDLAELYRAKYPKGENL